ncbi:hypothetical protein JD844_025156 [Phrynosoma platyrhinos]|uniref:Dynein heavy chain C-terminal domain-containing protein n=1 Tax=Phrynosoma platyrhinos TaxID=52577 RepID=A0ABQ7SZ40_PHRPL|nr:hypothetical protein JD844_025156 [Phrynosoma platyrhinos]
MQHLPPSPVRTDSSGGVQQQYSSVVYRPISETDSLKSCRTYLRSLPEADSPELFGMHDCAEKAYLKSQAQLFVESVVSTQPAVSTDTIISGGKSQDEIILEIASDILIRLPLTVEDMGQAPDTDGEVTEKITFRNFKLSPVWATLVKAAEGPCSCTSSTLLTVLQQEIDHYNNLLSIIIQSLCTLQQGIKGDIIFTTGLEELYNSILKSKVPKLWQQHSYETYKPLGSWIDDLIIQVNFFAMWSNRVITYLKSRFNHLMMLQRQHKTLFQTGEETDLFSDNSKVHPNCFWLPGFFFPHGFLTAVLQNYARQNEIPVDSLTFVHKVLSFTEEEEQNLRNFKRKETILNKAFTAPTGRWLIRQEPHAVWI